MLRLLTDVAAGDDLTRHWLLFLSIEDLKALSSVSRRAAQSPLRLSLATRCVWRLPYPTEWSVPQDSTSDPSSAPPLKVLPPFHWHTYERDTYLHTMDEQLKRQLRSVAVPRSQMLREVTAHLPSVTRICTWQVDSDIAGITQVSPLERRRIYKQLREIDFRSLTTECAKTTARMPLDTLAFRNASVVNLHCISSLHALTSLDLSRADVDHHHRTFQCLAPLTQLQTLNLAHTGLSDLGFLSSLTQLHTLCIAGSSLPSLVELAAVAPTLSSLDVSNVWLENEHVDLSSLTKLRELRAELLASMGPLDVHLDAPLLVTCSFRYCWLLHRHFFTQSPNLVELDLRDVILFNAESVSTTTTTALPSVSTLQLSSNPVALQSFDWSRMPQLETLRLQKWNPAFVHSERIDSAVLATLPRLRHLEIAKLSKYSALPPSLLRLVSLTIHQLKASHVPALQHLLVTNDVLETLGLCAEQAVHVELPPLAAPATLRELRLVSVTLTNLDALARCVGLRCLEISGFGTIACAATLHQFLPQCTRLRSLTICQNTAIDDVSPIAVLTQLEVLSVRHTSVTSITPLATMRTLRELDLGYTHVTDVTPLQSLARLQRVVLPAGVASACALFHDANAFPMLRSVVHEDVGSVRDCLCTGHDAVLPA